MLICMRTTLNIDDELFRKAKREASDRGITLTRFIEDAVRRALAPKRDEPYVFRWRTYTGGGTPAVDPADRDALYDWLDRNP